MMGNKFVHFDTFSLLGPTIFKLGIRNKSIAPNPMKLVSDNYSMDPSDPH